MAEKRRFLSCIFSPKNLFCGQLSNFPNPEKLPQAKNDEPKATSGRAVADAAYRAGLGCLKYPRFPELSSIAATSLVSSRPRTSVAAKFALGAFHIPPELGLREYELP
ncbi:MAG: hypothetical protein LBJ64_02440 [Deltaproteobacteria bacterium]|nr:hypothetical protein [Deltaproteobacteria bacterium]